MGENRESSGNAAKSLGKLRPGGVRSMSASIRAPASFSATAASARLTPKAAALLAGCSNERPS